MSTTQSQAKSCPSDFALDRFYAGEVQALESQSCATHIEGCPGCQDRIAQRELGFQAFGGSEQAYLARFQNRLDLEQHSSKQTRRFFAGSKARLFRRPLAWLMGPVAAGSLAAVALLHLPSTNPTPTQAPRSQANASRGQVHQSGPVRQKGQGALRAFVWRDGRAQKVTDATKLSPGERLRFSVTLDADRNIAIVGQESNHALYPIAVEDQDASFPMKSGIDQLLPQTIELDDSLGKEWIYLIACEHAFRLEDITVQRDDTLAIPDACELTGIQIDKVASKR